MDARQERGLQIAEHSKITKTPAGWKVPSQSGSGSYVVTLGDKPFCTCPDFERRGQPCKHIHAVEFILQREDRPDGTTIVTKAVRVTYKQDWTAYNSAQTQEQEHFVTLLRDLCSTVPQPPQQMGRPRLPLSDAIFGAVYKVYTTMSGRRVVTEIKDAEARGLLDKAPSFTSTFRYLESPQLTPILKALVEQSALPMSGIETDFAADSTGFATSTYTRWFDHKWGKERSEQKWIKAHVMVGTKTHIVTAVEATATESADAPQFPGLLQRTSEHFAVNEVSADKAYSSKRNLRAVQEVGGTAFIPFKSYVRGTQRHGEFDGLWQKAWHYYQFNRGAFLEHYHKRSNSETAFAMIKAKFGAAVRAKTPVAQVNEVLCKILCHNICVLIQSWYELGIVAVFTGERAKSALLG